MQLQDVIHYWLRNDVLVSDNIPGQMMKWSPKQLNSTGLYDYQMKKIQVKIVARSPSALTKIEAEKLRTLYDDFFNATTTTESIEANSVIIQYMVSIQVWPFPWDKDFIIEKKD